MKQKEREKLLDKLALYFGFEHTSKIVDIINEVDEK